MKRMILAAAAALLSVQPTSAQPARPSGAFLECYLLASGGADHSLDPDPAGYDLVGYVQWNNGPGQVIECREKLDVV
jgi:hypothetical protein